MFITKEKWNEGRAHLIDGQAEAQKGPKDPFITCPVEPVSAVTDRMALSALLYSPLWLPTACWPKPKHSLLACVVLHGPVPLPHPGRTTVLPRRTRFISLPSPCTCCSFSLGPASTSCSPGLHLLNLQYFGITSSQKASCLDASSPVGGACELPQLPVPSPPSRRPAAPACDPAHPPLSQTLRRSGGCSPGVGAGEGGVGYRENTAAACVWRDRRQPLRRGVNTQAVP